MAAKHAGRSWRLAQHFQSRYCLYLFAAVWPINFICKKRYLPAGVFFTFGSTSWVILASSRLLDLTGGIRPLTTGEPALGLVLEGVADAVSAALDVPELCKVSGKKI